METLSSLDKRFALLIDADNVSAKYIKPILDELSKYGTVTIKRIYGDWTSTLHAKWKEALLDNSITPIQQFSYTVGKNATDSAMIIDAMDILYTNSVDGFCLVSSDSDFTRLASRIRESGLTVVGMGEKKTPTPFRKACDVFTTLELLVGEARRGKEGATSLTIEEVERAVVGIITDNQNNGKSTGLGEVGSRLLKRYPDFDVRSFGTNLLSKLLSEFKSVNIRKEGSNVRVELAEGADHESASGKQQHADKPARSGKRSGKASQHAKGQAGKPEEQQPAADAPDEGAVAAETPEEDAAVAVEAAGAAEADASNAPEADEVSRSAKPRRRRGRRRKGASAHAAEAEAETQVASDAAPGEELADDAAADEEAAPESAPSPDVSPAEEKPVVAASGSKSENPGVHAVESLEAVGQGASDTANQEISVASVKPDHASASANAAAHGSANAKAEEAAGDAAFARTGAVGETASAGAPVDDAPAQGASEAPASKAASSRGKKRPQRSRKPKAARNKPASPDDFIRQTVGGVGPDGVAVAELARQVRARFKSFKVRDLGYPHMAGYLADVEGVRVYKQGRENWVAKE